MGEIVRQWKDHTTFAAVLRDVLMYMDRTFVPQHNLSPVFMLHMTLWRDTVVRNPSIKPRLVSTTLSMPRQMAAQESALRATTSPSLVSRRSLLFSAPLSGSARAPTRTGVASWR